MSFDILMLAVTLGLILLSSIIFTNGIEVLGVRLKVHQGAVGSILAAVGTALPETVIPIIAILIYRDANAEQVGIGAIAGAPFMLGTLAFFVTGMAVFLYSWMGRRTRLIKIDPDHLNRDLTFFIVLYGVAILTTFVHHILALKIAVALGLVLSYVWYVRRTLTTECIHPGEEPEDLYLVHFLHTKDTMVWVLVQVVGGLVLMIASAHFFIRYVTAVSLDLGVSTMILSIIITPIATELPEKCNSVIWIGRRKDVLALGNITGAMVFQSSFPVVFGILFTPWDLRGVPMVSALLAFASTLLVLIWVRWKKTLVPSVLLAGGLFYLAFLCYVFSHNIHR